MKMQSNHEKETHHERLSTLLSGILVPPSGFKRIGVALAAGTLVHGLFAAGVLSMIAAMFFGMSQTFGTLSYPLAIVANLLLLLQFPFVHSFLLTSVGSKLLRRFIAGPHGQTLSTTTYAIIASLQLLLLFTLWTPSGIVWWEASGALFYCVCAAYGASWLLLAKASFDAGVEVQSGALGWISLLKDVRVRFPDMPTTGLFRIIRQPIYVSFALTLWTVPIWTPDQLAVALTLTAYCLVAPILKEQRFKKRYGARFEHYRNRVPYIFPRIKVAK